MNFKNSITTLIQESKSIGQFTMLELFSGRGNISRAFKEQNFNTIEVDIRKRSGVCEPDIKVDLNTVRLNQIVPGSFNVLHAAVPCDAYSYSAGDYYFKNGIAKESAQQFIELTIHTLEIIKKYNPDIWFIENPRGHLRYQKFMIDFLSDMNGCIKNITLGSYGFPTTKPTDIFTNAHDWIPLKKLPYGRGNKNASGPLDNLTVCSKQATPYSLGVEMALHCIKKLSN